MIQIAKLIILLGLAITAAGGLLYLLGWLGLGKLPGDISFGGKSWRVFLPIGTCLLLSAILTLVLYLLLRFRR
jgi:hypothetical protein